MGEPRQIPRITLANAIRYGTHFLMLCEAEDLENEVWFDTAVDPHGHAAFSISWLRIDPAKMPREVKVYYDPALERMSIELDECGHKRTYRYLPRGRRVDFVRGQLEALRTGDPFHAWRKP